MGALEDLSLCIQCIFTWFCWRC